MFNGAGWQARKRLTRTLREGTATNSQVNSRDIPDISIVIVSWNTRDLLAACIESVMREADHTGLSCETIVVDNGSSDDSARLIRELYPEVSVLELGSNQGFAAANNRGISVASGRTIMLLNPDTVLQPDSLWRLWAALHAMPHVGLVGPALLNPDGTLQAAGFRFPGLMQSLLDFFPIHPRLIGSTINGRVSPGDGLSPVEIDHPLGACMLVRREVVDQVGALDETFFIYSEEIDWCQRIKAAGWTILTAPAAKVTHFGGQSTSQVPETMLLQLHQSRAAYFRRYRGDRFLRVLSLLARVAAVRARVQDGESRQRAGMLRAVARIYQGRGAEVDGATPDV